MTRKHVPNLLIHIIKYNYSVVYKAVLYLISKKITTKKKGNLIDNSDSMTNQGGVNHLPFLKKINGFFVFVNLHKESTQISSRR